MRTHSLPSFASCAQGDHDRAVDRLVEHCSAEELVLQVKKMLRFRHERCSKLEDKANDMRREVLSSKSIFIWYFQNLDRGSLHR